MLLPAARLQWVGRAPRRGFPPRSDGGAGAHAGIFKSSCYIDVRWFPFDVQQCNLKFGSWSYGGWSLDLQMQEADVSGYIPNGEWDLIGKP